MAADSLGYHEQLGVKIQCDDGVACATPQGVRGATL